MNDNLPGQTSEELSYEDAFQQLEGVVEALESGDQTLESALALFERGQALVRRCMSLLDTAELRIKQISGDQLVDFIGSE